MWQNHLLNWLKKVLKVQDEPAVEPSGELVTSLKHLVEQDDASVTEIMIHRADIVSVPLSYSKEQIAETMQKNYLSFVLVYDENPDNILGGVLCKDLFLFPDKSVFDLIKPPIFVSPTMLILDLLWKMRDSSNKYAVVVDEYGGVDGLVSFTDIIEKIIGTIHERQCVTFSYDGSVIVDGRTRLDELEALFGTSFIPQDLEDEDVETLGGLVSAIKGEFVKKGEHISLINNFEVEVIEADMRRVTLLALKKVV
jgi:magnesium and cobalt transporter